MRNDTNTRFWSALCLLLNLRYLANSLAWLIVISGLIVRMLKPPSKYIFRYAILLICSCGFSFVKD